MGFVVMAEPQTLDEVAREEVLRQLGNAHDYYVAAEERARSKGNHAEAEGAHQVSVWLLRAYVDEFDDIPPEFVP